MGRADPDRSGHPAAATAGTLDSGEQAAEETGQTQGQAEGGPAGQAGAGPPGIRAAVPRPRQAMTGTGRVRAAFRAPVARHIGILLAFIVAGAAATMPLAANLAGRIPAAGTRQATSGTFPGSLTSSPTWATRGSPRRWRRR